jgi:hypothetical protein
MINRNGAAAALVVVIAIGDAALFVVTHNFVLRSAGMAALVFAVYFLRNVQERSHDNSNINSNRTLSGQMDSNRKISTLMWIKGIVMLGIFGVSCLFLYLDVVEGYNRVAPLYAFAISGLVAGMYWAYLFTKWMT